MACQHPVTSQLGLFAPALSYPARPVVTSAALSPVHASPKDKIVAGTCRFCGCHGDACLTRAGDRCDWADAARTACTGEPCVHLFAAEAKQPKRAAKAAPTSKPIRRRRGGRPYSARAAWNAWYLS